jgi:hypothetical protein
VSEQLELPRDMLRLESIIYHTSYNNNTQLTSSNQFIFSSYSVQHRFSSESVQIQFSTFQISVQIQTNPHSSNSVSVQYRRIQFSNIDLFDIVELEVVATKAVAAQCETLSAALVKVDQAVTAIPGANEFAPLLAMIGMYIWGDCSASYGDTPICSICVVGVLKWIAGNFAASNFR